MESHAPQADKPCKRGQHAAMRIVCPHCQAVYQVESAEPDTVFVCHRCNAEFGFGQTPEGAEPLEEGNSATEAAAGSASESSPETESAATEAQDAVVTAESSGTAQEVPVEEDTDTSPGEVAAEAQAADTSAEESPQERAAPETSETPAEPASETESSEHKEEPEEEIEELFSESAPEAEPQSQAEPTPQPQTPPSREEPAPKKRKARFTPPLRMPANIWPWLFGILFVLIGSGLWFTHGAWLNGTWLRSTLIDVGLPISVHDEDWKIIPGSVHATWVTRSDNSHILVIRGTIRNTLQCELPAPSIRIKLYEKEMPSLVLDTRVIPITQLPLPITINRSPYIMPPVDHRPVGSNGERNFELVLETLPENVGNFALSPAVEN